MRHRADVLVQAARSVGAPGDMSRPGTPGPNLADTPPRRTVLQEVGRWVVPFFETLLPFGDPHPVNADNVNPAAPVGPNAGPNAPPNAGAANEAAGAADNNARRDGRDARPLEAAA